MRDLGRDWEGGRGAEDYGDSTAQVGEEKAKVVRKFEHWGTTFVSPQRSGRCRLTAVPNRAGAEARSRGTGLTAVLGGHPAGLALKSRSPRCRRRQQPLPPPLPNHPSDTRAAASQHVGRGRCWNRGGRLGTNTDRAGHKGSDSSGRRGRLARTQIVEAESAATVVPPEAKEEGLLVASPDTLCATGSLTPSSSPHPSQTDFRVWLQPFPHPPRREQPVLAASSFRLPSSRHAPRNPNPFTGTAARRACASWYRRSPPHALALGLRRQTGDGARVGPLYHLNQLRPRNPLPALFEDTGALDFV